MTKAKRYNNNKVEFDDIPMLGMVEVAKVGAYGRSKYGKQNWRGEASTSQYLNCAFRHLIKYMYGEDVDDESGCNHLGHVAWNVLAAIEKCLMKKSVDDRFRYDNDVNVSSLFKIEGEITTHNGLTDADLNDMESEYLSVDDIELEDSNMDDLELEDPNMVYYNSKEATGDLTKVTKKIEEIYLRNLQND